MSKLELVSFNLCPFVQRSRIALLEKGVDHDVTYIDLADKPAWFLEISPFGKVPLLKVDGRVLFESNVIAEYLDEVHEPQLHPVDPLDKAEQRAWIEYIGSLGGPGYMLMVEEDEAKAKSFADKANTALERVEARVAGPYFNGENFSLLDASAAPFLQRLFWAHELAPELGIFEGRPKCLAWTHALLERASVRASLIDGIHSVYLDYLRGAGSPARKAPASWLASKAALSLVTPG